MRFVLKPWCRFCNFITLTETPSNYEFENLTLVYASCHTKITGGFISEAEVRLKKGQLLMPGKTSRVFTSEHLKGVINQSGHDPNDPIVCGCFSL